MIGQIILKNYLMILYTLSIGVPMILLIIYIFEKEKYDLMLSFYEKDNLQVEYQQILNNLDQAIITDTDKGLKFFNSSGFKLLNEQLNLSTNAIDEVSNECIQEIQRLQNKINKFEIQN